jgi:hypothetical protein
MMLYADRRGPAGRQFVSDVGVLVWVGSWSWVATKVYGLVETLAVPGKKLEDAATGIAVGLSNAGDRVGNVPGVEDALASPLDKVASSAQSLAEAGREQHQSVHQLAIVIVVALLVVPWG